jgi:hypothetical protein
MLTQGTLRPSNLPKLKHCAWYRNSEPSEAAGRGTRIDTVYRDILAGLKDFPDGSAAEIAAADWAACQTSRIVGDHPVLTRKEDCGVTIPGFPAPGEVDAISPNIFTSFDLKTGQQYDYQLQMAAYAWGLMEKYFMQRWITWILFCDFRRVYKYVFAYAEARRTVLEIRQRYEAAAAPVFNLYCSWCANAPECPVSINRADHALALAEKPHFDFTALLANQERLGAFLTACRALEPYQLQAQDRAKQYLLAGTKVPGWSLVTRSPGKYVEPTDVVPLVDKLGADRVLSEYGNLSEAKYRKLSEEAGLEPDSSVVKQGAGTTYLRSTSEVQEINK